MCVHNETSFFSHPLLEIISSIEAQTRNVQSTHVPSNFKTNNQCCKISRKNDADMSASEN